MNEKYQRLVISNSPKISKTFDTRKLEHVLAIFGCRLNEAMVLDPAELERKSSRLVNEYRAGRGSEFTSPDVNQTAIMKTVQRLRAFATKAMENGGFVATETATCCGA